MPARVALVLAVTLAGLAAGFFVTYSISVVRGLALVDDETYVAAFQAINATVRNGWFAVIFFGTLVAAALAALLLAGSHRPAAVLAGLGLVAYASGVLGLTFGLHVPLNEALAAVGAVRGEDATTARTAFEATWTRWNHLRALAALGSFLFLLAALERVAAASRTTAGG